MRKVNLLHWSWTTPMQNGELLFFIYMYINEKTS